MLNEPTVRLDPPLCAHCAEPLAAPCWSLCGACYGELVVPKTVYVPRLTFWQRMRRWMRLS